MRRFATLIAVALLALSLAHAAAPVPLALDAERSGGKTRITIDLPQADGASRRVTLRETTSDVVLKHAERLGDGASIYALWEEAGQRWSAFSTNGGANFVEAEPVRTALQLRDGVTEPGQAIPAVPQGFAQAPEARVSIVQFSSTSLPAMREALRAKGAEILAAMPFHAHLVRLTPAAAAAVSSLRFVERVEPYHAWYRLGDDVRDWLQAAGGSPERRRVRVVAFEWGQAGKARVRDAALAMGAEVAEFWPNGHLVELWLSPAQVRALAQHDDVMWMDLWTPKETDMDLVRQDSGTRFIEDTLGYCGQGVRGEVMDSGVEDTHQDFDGILLHGGNSSSSHGTSTYGIVFGNGDRDGDGSAQALGHMPCAQGIFADYDFLGDRFAHTQQLKASPYFASFQTNSWGDARTTEYNSISFDMDDIIWRLDIVITQSQSNAGNQQSRPQAWSKNIVSIGGVYHRNTLDTSDDAWDGGASIGPAADGRIKPDLNYWYDNIYTTTTGNSYTSGFNGTSAATPETAGVVGIMFQMWSENVFGTDPQGGTVFERQPAFSTMKALMINTAQQYTFSGESSDLTRVHQGWGRPNVRNAYDRANKSFIVDEAERLEVGEEVEYTVQVQPGESELKVTMVFPDPPGTTSAALHRINNLDLKVTSPSGVVYWGNNGLRAGNYSTPGGTADTIDTVENVFVQNPEAGSWTVEVRAAEINQDAVLGTPESDATFGLVVTGGTAQTCDGALVDFTITPNPGSIGETITFDSTVDGVGPFEYAWDFERDGTIDATTADATHVYDRPYDGLVRLTVRDGTDCPTESERSIQITGPDLRYDGYTTFEIEGNGNGLIDPGEVFDIEVRMENVGNEAALGSTGGLSVSAATLGPVSLLNDATSYGDVGIGATGLSAPRFRFQVGQSFPCGEQVIFDVVATRSADPNVLFPDEPQAIRLLVGGTGEPEVFFSDGFETTAGWTASTGSDWQIGDPTGLGSGSGTPEFQPKPDPRDAYAGSQVAGTDVTGLGLIPGNYENNVSSRFTSPVIDASQRVLVQLDLHRWLNVIPGDTAYIEVTPDGTEWQRLWESSEEGLAEGEWVPMSFDLSAIADRAPALRLRFGLDSDNAASASGWNIDALTLTGVPRDTCGLLSRAEPGVIDGLTVAKDGASGLALTWGADCGGVSSYAIYRGDLALGLSSLAPDSCAIAGTSATIAQGTGAADFFLVVPNDGAFEGGYGTNSTGAARPAPESACYPRDLIDACAP